MVSPGAHSDTRSPFWLPESFPLEVEALESSRAGDDYIPGKRGEPRWGGGVSTRWRVMMGEVEVRRLWAKQRGVTCNMVWREITWMIASSRIPSRVISRLDVLGVSLTPFPRIRYRNPINDFTRILNKSFKPFHFSFADLQHHNTWRRGRSSGKSVPRNPGARRSIQAR